MSTGLPFQWRDLSLEKALPYLVAILSVVTLILLPISISNFNTIHSKGGCDGSK